ncbi:ATP-dependent nuclease [Pseudomonas extremaustralis]|uniref:ATP-dependent nuclease n=1 Tax=Pseudomonas extremaustralis TaxID=359110 RepID=UPI0023E01E6E|nr:ATP-binding protein [Pseudomonas extremaustralis]MDF3132779.1 ATP-binding protein [Pseudomonas extremaustralis]
MTIDTSFWVRNYRSFKEDGAGFLVIKPVNVIVGKNNIGKSSLIAAVDHMFREHGVEGEIGKSIEFGDVLTEAELQPHFSHSTAGGDLPNNHWRGHGQNFIGKRVVWREPGRDVEVLRIEGYENDLLRGERSRIGAAVAASKRRNFRHVRLDADRDLVKELYTQEFTLKSNGEGATNIIQSYINSSNLDRDLIQVRLLTALNVIFTPDTVFSEIVVQHHSDSNKWEIYLGEEGKGLIPLSASGSGLKTVILTLLNLLVRPDFEKKDIASYIFSFEELENNLHPSLQRNLFSFLLDYAQSKGCHVFLTTHSQVAIDLFHGENDAQILHVKKQDGEVLGLILDDLNRGYSVLDDLGAKASDILQANGIIWVEGPSDRIYLNKFIELWGEGAYKEGHHYQFIYYGGSVLAHIDASTPEADLQEAVSAIKINRNFIFACDSDRSNKNGKLKNRVTELLSNVARDRGYVWVTRCREIENYIPKECFESVYGESGLPQIGEYEYVQDYLRNNNLSRAAEFTDKHHKAVKFSEAFSKDNLSFRPELGAEMTAIIQRLMIWNS